MSKWYDDSNELRLFQAAMMEAEGFPNNVEHHYFLEKPYKWNPEHDAWVEADKPLSEEDDGWEDFVEFLAERD